MVIDDDEKQDIRSRSPSPNGSLSHDSYKLFQLESSEEQPKHKSLSPDSPPQKDFIAMELHYQNIEVGVSLTQSSSFLKCRKKKKHYPILQNVSGTIEQGKLTAIMGQSGSGKTTLLNTLSGRLKTNSSCKVSGKVFLNGQLCPRKLIRRVSGYVMQEDVMLGTSTPREAILFSSIMRLQESISLQQKKELTQKILDDLGLERCADTVCGTMFKRGLSGGEKKRVSIGVELVTNPTLLFLDEPSTGLDSSTALVIMRLLKTMTNKGRTVVCTVHSPSASIFRLFDKLLLLHSGRTIFSGSPEHVTSFFHSFGFPPPDHSTLSDYCMEMLCIDEHAQTLDRMASEYSLQQLSAGPLMERKDSEEAQDDLGELTNGPKFPLSFSSQFYYLTRRAWRQSYRQPFNTAARLIQNVVLALFVGILFGGAGGSQKAQRALVSKVGFAFFMICVNSLLGIVSSVVLFHEERSLYFREKATKVYRTSAYFLGKTVIELPLQILTPFLFGSIPYYMIGMKPEWNFFFRFSLGLVVLGQASEALGLILGALVKTPTTAVMMSPLFLIPFLLVTGFFLNLNSIPLYMVWIKVLSPQKYVFAALLQTEFKDLQFYCSDDELIRTPAGDLCPFTSGEQVLGFFSIFFTPSQPQSDDVNLGLEEGGVWNAAWEGVSNTVTQSFLQGPAVHLRSLMDYAKNVSLTLLASKHTNDLDPAFSGPSPHHLDQTAMYPSTESTTPTVDQFDYWGNILMCLLLSLLYRWVAYLTLRYTTPRTMGK